MNSSLGSTFGERLTCSVLTTLDHLSRLAHVQHHFLGIVMMQIDGVGSLPIYVGFSELLKETRLLTPSSSDAMALAAAVAFALRGRRRYLPVAAEEAAAAAQRQARRPSAAAAAATEHSGYGTTNPNQRHATTPTGTVESAGMRNESWDELHFRRLKFEIPTKNYSSVQNC